MKKPEAPCLWCENSGKLHKRCCEYHRYKNELEQYKNVVLGNKRLETETDTYEISRIRRINEGKYRKNKRKDI